MATEIALVNNKVLSTYQAADYLRMGISVPLYDLTARRTDLLSASEISLNGHQAWHNTYNHLLGKNDERMHAVRTITVVIPSSPEAFKRARKNYVVAECSTGAHEALARKTEKEIFDILNTIRLGPISDTFILRGKRQ